MPTFRTLLAAVCAAPLLAAPAGAAARTCALLPGHAESPGADKGVNAAVHIRSADIASDARNVTAVVRVRSVHELLEPATARYYAFFFSRNVEENYVLEASVWPGEAPRFTLATVDKPFGVVEDDVTVTRSQATLLGRVTGVIDGTRNEVRITAPFAAFRKRSGTTMRPGATVTYLAGYDDRTYGADRYGLPVDPGVGTGVAVGGSDFVYGNRRVTYTLGTPSCVPVGR